MLVITQRYSEHGVEGNFAFTWFVLTFLAFCLFRLCWVFWRRLSVLHGGDEDHNFSAYQLLRFHSLPTAVGMIFDLTRWKWDDTFEQYDASKNYAKIWIAAKLKYYATNY